MKKAIFILLIVAGCHKTQKNENIHDVDQHLNSIKDTLVKDTSMLGMRISQQEYDKLEKLKKKDRKVYARIILKQYAFCNCMLSTSQNDSIFMSEDASSMILSKDFVIHKHDVIDSINKLVTEYLLPPAKLMNFEHSLKNQSSRCLNLYTSEYLDSVIKTYDNKILMKDD